MRPLDAFHTTGYTRQTAGMRRRTEQSHVAGSLSVRRLEGGGGHIHRVRAHRHCAHQCSQGHRARGRTRCCTRTQSAVAHCTTTAPRCTQATMSSGTHSRGRCSGHASRPMHHLRSRLNVCAVCRSSGRPNDVVRAESCAVLMMYATRRSPGAHGRRAVSWRAGLKPRPNPAINATPWDPLPRAHCSERLLDD